MKKVTVFPVFLFHKDTRAANLLVASTELSTLKAGVGYTMLFSFICFM